jgi:hypothetical protein
MDYTGVEYLSSCEISAMVASYPRHDQQQADDAAPNRERNSQLANHVGQLIK